MSTATTTQRDLDWVKERADRQRRYCDALIATGDNVDVSSFAAEHRHGEDQVRQDINAIKRAVELEDRCDSEEHAQADCNRLTVAFEAMQERHRAEIEEAFQAKADAKHYADACHKAPNELKRWSQGHRHLFHDGRLNRTREG